MCAFLRMRARVFGGCVRFFAFSPAAKTAQNDMGVRVKNMQVKRHSEPCRRARPKAGEESHTAAHNLCKALLVPLSSVPRKRHIIKERAAAARHIFMRAGKIRAHKIKQRVLVQR